MARVFNDPKRQTGRTTRMVRQAIEAASSGRAVYILAERHIHAYIADLIPNRQELGIKIETPGDLHFDWTHMVATSAHPNCLFFVDHYTIEQRYARLLAEYHAYDEEA